MESLLKVVIIRKVPEETKQLIIRQFPPDWLVVTVAEDEITDELKDADVIIPEHVIVDGSFLDKAKKLKLVQTGAGYGNVNIDECTKRGIYVANAAGVNAQAVAEHVFAFILCWFKNIHTLDRNIKAGKDTVDYIGVELSEKIIGILGLGHIGKEVARLATGFNMKVLGYHKRIIDEGIEIELVDLRKLLRLSDIITLHVSFNSQTKHMIGSKEFELMKNEAFFINTSRGPVVDEYALVEALQSKKIGGAGLDVFDTEPLPQKSPLRKLTNVILTPHTAGEPDRKYFHAKRYQFFAENIKRVSQGNLPLNALNQL
jgi:D-3-phosphoglycerate dehydrogenase